MQRKSWHDQWIDVDKADDPGFFVRFLDETRVGNLLAIEANPQNYYAFLAPREGMSVLDVGTGSGTLLHGLAKLVGPNGRVVGIDYSKTMIEEAIRRAPADLPLEFIVDDAYAMQFDDNSFDAASSNIVFQHLPNPDKPLSEMVRVAKPGGRVVLTEQDWDTFFFDCGEKDLTRRIVAAFSDTVPNGQIGRALPRMFANAGLEQISVQGIPFVITGQQAHMLDSMVEGHLSYCFSEGVVNQAEFDSWLQEYKSRVNSGTMTIGFLIIRATGFKPGV